MRSCRKCGTEFKETLKSQIDIIDHPPECHQGNKLNGICVNCCECAPL